MLHEVITRRLKRAVAEASFPDLLVIDGGKGQLNAALAAAHDLGRADEAGARKRGYPLSWRWWASPRAGYWTTARRA